VTFHAHDVGVSYIEQSSGRRCNSVQHRLDLGRRAGDDAQHLRRRFLLLQRLIPLTFEQRILSVGVGASAPPTDLWRTGVLRLGRRASGVFHGIAICCARAQSGLAAATLRITGNPRRFLTDPDPGADIVSAQAKALEGARTGFVQLLSETRPNVTDGSIATDLRWSRNVRFSPESDRLLVSVFMTITLTKFDIVSKLVISFRWKKYGIFDDQIL
jgi:hypothetical protein